MFDEIKQRREQEREKQRANNSERILTALSNIPIAFFNLLSFTIRNLPWIALVFVVCAVVLIIKVPGIQEMFIQALARA